MEKTSNSTFVHVLIALYCGCLMMTCFTAPFIRRTLMPDHVGPEHVWGPLEHRALDEIGGPRDAAPINYWVFYVFCMVTAALTILAACVTCFADETECNDDLRSAVLECSTIGCCFDIDDPVEDSSPGAPEFSGASGGSQAGRRGVRY